LDADSYDGGTLMGGGSLGSVLVMFLPLSKTSVRWSTTSAHILAKRKRVRGPTLGGKVRGPKHDDGINRPNVRGFSISSKDWHTSFSGRKSGSLTSSTEEGKVVSPIRDPSGLQKKKGKINGATGGRE